MHSVPVFRPPLRMSLRPGRALAVSAAAALIAVATGCASADVSGSTSGPGASTTLGGPTKLVLVGDSLAEEAAPLVAFLLPGVTVVDRHFGGTAPCDWTAQDLEADASSVVVISFTGNSGTPCMSDGASDFIRGDALIDKYRDDVRSLVESASAAGAMVMLVGQPTRADAVPGTDDVDALNEVYTELAEADGVGFVDAGAAVEDDGAYAPVLPCLPTEPECNASGENVVRSNDGLHFCPGDYETPCPVYSAGAFRFAASIVDATKDPAAFE